MRALNGLNREFDPSDGDALEQRIGRIRDEPGQLAFGVPETSLNGHAFHTYTLKSSTSNLRKTMRNHGKEKERDVVVCYGV